MDKFVLKTDLTPKGDQPEAIKALADGIKRGEKFQTLLGVTGSGKSVTADTPVLIYKRDDVGHFEPKILKIGEFIDILFSKSKYVQNSNNETEILYSVDLESDFFVPSLNPITKCIEIKPITAFVRHFSPEKLYKVQTACGRSAVLTGDHNFHVLRDGRLKLVETKDLKNDDYIPLPKNLEQLAYQYDLEYIDLQRYLKIKTYVNAQEPLKACVSFYGITATRRAFKSSFRNSDSKFSAVLNHAERLDLDSILKFSYKLPLLQTFDFVAKTRLGDMKFPVQYPLSQDFLTFLGVYIAEGWAGYGYVLLSVREKEFFAEFVKVLDRLGFTYKVRNSGDIVIYSWLLENLVKNMCGSGSRNKKLPDFCSKLSLKQLAVLLRAYFAGDGGVECNSVNFTTASKVLASDLQYALLRFDIWARCHKRFKRACNTNDTGDFYYCLSVSGQEDLFKFKEKIGFFLDRKNLSLSKIVGRKFNTNVDFIPGAGNLIFKIRTKYRLFQKDIAKMAALNRSMISMVESNKRKISRQACMRLLKNLKIENFCCELIAELEGLLNLRWTSVKFIKEIRSDEKYVYDFSVKDNETFLAGYGGMFIHNTYTMAKVVEALNRPALVLVHNKTLAAQLCSEFQEFFPNNAISYFVSYYDYYQPEAYLPATDTYIEKDASINEEIDKFRHAATANLLTRKDVLIVASVSCIYGLGSVEDYNSLARTVKVGDTIVRDKFLRHLTELQYTRSHMEFKNGMFHVLGDTIEVFPPDRDNVFRIEFFGDEIEAVSEVDGFTGELIQELNSVTIFPAKHDVTTKEKIEKAVAMIRVDMDLRYKELLKQGRNIEAERIKTRTEYDIEILLETGYCSGIENYTRYLQGALPGQQPSTLLDYLPDDFLLFIDESHMTVPQIGGMHNGNFSRKQTLIEHGFRLPSAHDNRPLKFEEFEKYMKNTVFVSATPGPYEFAHTAKKSIVELVVRPTGLIDPEISVRPSKGQMEDLLKEIAKRVKMGDRVLITTLTKRNAEDLAEFLSDADIRVKYLHSDIATLERIEILRDLRLGKFDVLVGINLLREGLDLPEVSLVVILDADKEGFLRSASALIQTVGRCARNVNSFVIMYADRHTDAMKKAISETGRRREKQIEYNKKHGITPETIKKAVRDISHYGGKKKKRDEALDIKKIPKDEAKRIIETLEDKMDLASQNLEFERAGELRDEIEALREEFGL